MLQPLVRRTWAPRGRTPTQKTWDRHDRLSVISALTVAPRRRRLGLYFQVHRHNIRTEQVVGFLRSLHRRLGRNIIVVMDRWSVHRAALRRLVEAGSRWLAVEWLPAYAPELNPTEQVWNHTKYGDLANYIPDDIDALCREVERSIGAKRSRARLLRSFFNHAELHL